MEGGGGGGGVKGVVTVSACSFYLPAAVPFVCLRLFVQARTTVFKVNRVLVVFACECEHRKLRPCSPWCMPFSDACTAFIV